MQKFLSALAVTMNTIVTPVIAVTTIVIVTDMDMDMDRIPVVVKTRGGATIAKTKLLLTATEKDGTVQQVARTDSTDVTMIATASAEVTIRQGRGRSILPRPAGRRRRRPLTNNQN